MNYTLSYTESEKGFPSFYSFYPDFMIGMNNYFYTFKGGNLYRHNVNTKRNTFYEDWFIRMSDPTGAFTPSRIVSVFNDSPLENKLFKTLNIEGDDTWSASLYTDLQGGAYVEANWFEKKEQSYFAFIRMLGTTPATPNEYALRSVNGIGRSITIDSFILASVIVNFAITPTPIVIGSILSVGDMIYYIEAPTNTPLLFGQVSNIVVDYPSGLNRIFIDATIPFATVPTTQTPYIMFIKNSIAESHGILGHYCVFELENQNDNKVELFVLESDVMKSYP